MQWAIKAYIRGDSLILGLKLMGIVNANSKNADINLSFMMDICINERKMVKDYEIKMIFGQEVKLDLQRINKAMQKIDELRIEITTYPKNLLQELIIQRHINNGLKS
jgi:hypothetical protein